MLCLAEQIQGTWERPYCRFWGIF